MDSTPQDERVTELAGLDPADAVAPAQELADALEASLETPGTPAVKAEPETPEASLDTPEAPDAAAESDEADAPPT